MAKAATVEKNGLAGHVGGSNGNLAHIRDLIPDKTNRRSHNPRNVGMVVDSLHAVGAARSIVIDEQGVVLAGNATLEAAGEAGIERVQVVDADGETLVAVRRTGLSADQKRQLAMYDNRTAELAEWNAEQLQADLSAGLDLKPWFSDEELARVVPTSAKAGLTDPDEAPAERATDIKLGDLFELGNHRLLCGDSTKAEDVARVMGGEKAAIVFADPPYGMRLDTDWSGAKSDLRFLKKNIKGGRKYAPVVGDGEDYDPAPLLDLWSAPEMFLWGADYYAERLPTRNAGSWFVWDKRLDESADEMFGSCFELCWSRSRHRREMVRVKWAGVFGTEQEPDHKRYHPTQKPVALVSWFLQRFDGAVVGDPYSGAGTVLLACEQLGRKCRAIEIEPCYVQVAIDRWEAFVGKKAVKVQEAVQ